MSHRFTIGTAASVVLALLAVVGRGRFKPLSVIESARQGPNAGRRRTLHLGQSVNQLFAGMRSCALGPKHPQNSGEAGAAEIGHAHRPQSRARVFVDRINRHDVGVLELRQCLWLVPQLRGNFESDETVCQVALLRQVDAAESALSQLFAQMKTDEFLAWFGKNRWSLFG